jgi:hypothetical protein
MIKNQRALIYTIILIPLTVIIIYKSAFTQTSAVLNALLLNYGIQFKEGGSLPVIKNFQYGGKGKTYHTIIAQDNKTHIEMEIITLLSEQEAQDYAHSKYIIIKSLYAPQIIPYTGALTTTTECPKDKKPREITIKISGRPQKVLLANATERYVLGVWEDDLIKKKAAFTVFYNRENNTLFQITVFQPVDSFDLNEVLKILKSLETIKKN